MENYEKTPAWDSDNLYPCKPIPLPAFQKTWLVIVNTFSFLFSHWLTSSILSMELH